ncbi:MAG: ATP-binding protein [Pseudomonadota bacterium]
MSYPQQEKLVNDDWVGELPDTQGTLFADRFLGKYAGAIMADPTNALVELVANSWDAYATEVSIVWPETKSDALFSIRDNGSGMTNDEFSLRWRTLDYDRTKHQGSIANPPEGIENARPRRVYGNNGRGRHAAFHFSSPYRVLTTKDGQRCQFEVTQGTSNPIEIELLEESSGDFPSGTEIMALHPVGSALSPEDVRALLSTRFLLDPQFSVDVNGVAVTFADVPPGQIKEVAVEVADYGTANLRVMDSSRADRTSKQHGIAWWVNRRLVGEASWTAFSDRLIDGRTEEAKRFSFIVETDFLTPEDILPDWSAFREDRAQWKTTKSVVHDQIRTELSELLNVKRKQTRTQILATHAQAVHALPKLSQDRWNGMLDELIERCPTLGEAQLDQVMGILANLELAQSQYSLLAKLHELSPNDLDSWNGLLEEWSVKSAKEALDEVSRRLKLIEEIRIKTSSTDTKEVQELKPLFGEALWIFGPQFESIEFTSNKGMTRVIRELFGVEDSGSRQRPDFAILPDSTVGFYDRPSFDEEHNQDGCDTLIIVELKKPGVPLGGDEKKQVWGYIKELREKGHISTDTRVTGFLLGDEIEPQEGDPERHGDRTIIRPMLYATFIGQAEKRMMNLHERLAEAPFLNRNAQQSVSAQSQLLTEAPIA